MGKARASRWALYVGLALLFLLRYDLWLWDDRSLFLGIPIGLAYHVGFCVVTSAAFAILVRWAWPSDGDDG